MTVTASISGQSIGTSTNIGPDKFPQKVTCQSGTDRFFIEATVTNGAASYDPANAIVIFYSSYSQSATANAALIDKLRKNARRLDVKPRRLAASVVVLASDLEPLSGPYIYLWCEIPTVSVAQTLDVNVVEGP